MWLAAPRPENTRLYRAIGKMLASTGLLVMLWQFPRSNDVALNIGLAVSSGGLIASSAATVIAKQLRSAAIYFWLTVLFAYGFLMLAGQWAMALAIAILLTAIGAAAKKLLSTSDHSLLGTGTETASWEPMLASAVSAVIVGIIYSAISHSLFGDSSLAFNANSDGMANKTTLAYALLLSGSAVVGTGLMGSIIHRTNKRQFFSVGLIIIGSFSTSFAWSVIAGRFINDIITAIIAAVGAAWIATCLWLLRLQTPQNERPIGKLPADQHFVRNDTHFYTLLIAISIIAMAAWPVCHPTANPISASGTETAAQPVDSHHPSAAQKPLLSTPAAKGPLLFFILYELLAIPCFFIIARGNRFSRQTAKIFLGVEAIAGQLLLLGILAMSIATVPDEKPGRWIFCLLFAGFAIRALLSPLVCLLTISIDFSLIKKLILPAALLASTGAYGAFLFIWPIVSQHELDPRSWTLHIAVIATTLAMAAVCKRGAGA